MASTGFLAHGKGGDDADIHHMEDDVYTACKDFPEGADFVIAAFVQSLRSYRRPTVCVPFPKKLFITDGPEPSLDYSAAEDAVAYIPSVHSIASAPPPSHSRPAAAPAPAPASAPPPAAAEAAAATASFDSPGTSDRLGPPSSAERNPIREMPLKSLRLLHWLLRMRALQRLVADPGGELGGLLPPDKSPWGAFGAAAGLGGPPPSPFRSPVLLPEQRDLLPHFVLEVPIPGSDQRAAFEAAKATHGSFAAFHGTAAENIHSILRFGLLNLSGTRLEKNGAIFGEGIYLSSDPSVALSFCTAGEGWERSSFGARARYLLLCEVAEGPGVSLSSSIARRSYRDGGAEASASTSTSSRVNANQGGIGGPRREEEPGSSGKSTPGAEERPLGTYILVQNCEMIRVRYVFVYSEPSRLAGNRGKGPSAAGRAGGSGNGPRGSDGGHGQARLGVAARDGGRQDLCKLLVYAYVGLLLAVGFFNSDLYRHNKLLIILQGLRA